ncbi:MAG TPA: sigma-70 family RNA polymerase sigma factor [Kofleriaceae bacterium]
MLDLVAHGDMKGALRRLMERHGGAVYRFCREELRDATLADDVHQQVFIQVYRDLAKFHRRSTVKTWLYAIARHRVLDAAKSRRRAEAHIESDDATAVPDPRPPASERIDDDRLREALAQCFERLSDRTRTVLLLRFQQGFTFEDIAQVCDEKAGTLQAQVSRVLPVLRDCIERRTGGSV